MDLSEKETREKIIDPQLIEDASWKEEYIRREVNSVKSDFKIKKYEVKKGEGKEEGRFIDYALLDSDNEIISKYWLAKMVKPLLDDPNLFGVESYYFPKKGESIYNTYCMVAHIADPFSRSIAGKLEQKQKSGYIELTIPKNSSYPLGANGFLWNKRVIKKVGQYSQKFEESNFSFFAKEAGFRKFARIPGVGIYHYHVNSLRDFINKRLKIGNKYLNRKDEKKRTWVEGIPKLRFVMSAVYCASIIGPFIEGVFNCIKERQKAWLLHPLMCFVSVVSYLVVFIKRRFLI